MSDKPVQMRTHTMRIADAQAYKDWCKLLGMKIPGDTVTITHEFYMKHGPQISAIQMMSAMRIHL